MIRSAEPAAASTRRAARAASVRVRRRRFAALVAVVAVAMVVVAFAIAALIGSGSEPEASAPRPDRPASIESLPAPQFTTVAPAPSVCDDPAVAAAVQAGDDEAVVVAAGGGAAFREAVVSGTASACISLSDPARRWVVVNKLRPLSPLAYVPENLVQVQSVQTMNSGILRQDAAEGLQAMATAIEQAGIGRIGQLSGYRSYDVQVTTYAENVAKGGQAEADISSARPGFSEHQLGITMDLMPCSDGCGSLDDFGGSPEGQWVAENCWQFGFVVRYEEGYTGITGYEAEPWHLRYLGPELARAYHEGGWHTLEEFFGLPAAPGYAG